ncbi:EAL domain-containing protein [Shewanella sairae]|nr:EAL domain-containing protein [Shewanella sairae]
MLPSKHKLLLVELVHKIYSFQRSNSSSMNYSYFLKVERFSLLDQYVVEKLCDLSRYIECFGSTLIVEITERHLQLYKYTIEGEYALKDAGAILALDGFTYESNIVLDVTRHDVIKLELSYVRESLAKAEFIEWLYTIKELGIKIVAKQVQTKEDYDLTLSLPFDYVQGYYEVLN